MKGKKSKKKRRKGKGEERKKEKEKGVRETGLLERNRVREREKGRGSTSLPNQVVRRRAGDTDEGRKAASRRRQ